MSDYCTECVYIKHEKTETDSEHSCGKFTQEHRLTRLCGNPKKHGRCISENWYEKQKEKTMNTKEKIKVMQTYEDGSKIQIKGEPTNNEWVDYDYVPDWNWVQLDYRIKPEPKYRQLKPEELITLKGKWLKDLSGSLYFIESIFKQHVGVVGIKYDSIDLLKEFTYEDGTPVGVLD